MNKTKPIGTLAQIAGLVILLHGFPVYAAEPAPGSPDRPAGHTRAPGWIEHTQHTLDELKLKLNLAPGQVSAWEVWSSGVLKDAREQLEPGHGSADAKTGMEKHQDASTPEQMSRGIERLREEIAWKQGHLVKLEAAQARTQAFYDKLETNQKTIFDLFWHEVYHRMSGHDGGWDSQDAARLGPGNRPGRPDVYPGPD